MIIHFSRPIPSGVPTPAQRSSSIARQREDEFLARRVELGDPSAKRARDSSVGDGFQLLQMNKLMPK